MGKNYISLLRGINVGGQKKIKMDDLVKTFQSLALENVSTYIQSGNVLFTCAETNSKILRNKLEAKIQKEFGFDVTVFIRNQNEWKTILENNPFLSRKKIDSSKLHVTFLSDLPDVDLSFALKAPANTSDEFIITGREIYLFCPDGYGKTKLNNQFFEKKLGRPATTRNWNTVYKLFELSH